MANCMISYPNLIDSASVSGGSWLSAMPLNNILNRTIGLKARSSNDNASSTQFETNLGSAQTVRVVGIIGHNLSSGATYRIRSSSVAGTFTSPIYDSGTISIGDNTFDLIHVLSAGSSARYWLVELIDTSNPYNYVEIGRAFFGNVFQPTINMNFGINLGYVDESNIEKAYDGTEYFSTKKRMRTASFILDNLTDSEAWTTMMAMQKAMGINGEMLFVYDSADSTYNKQRNFLCRNETLSPIEAVRYGANACAIKLRELI